MIRRYLILLSGLLLAVSTSMLAKEPVIELQQERAAISAGKVVVDTQLEGTEFGRQLLDYMTSNNIPTKLPKEKILAMKPGSPEKFQARSKFPAISEDIQFTGYLMFSRVGSTRTMRYGFYTFNPAQGFVRESLDADYCINGGGVYVDNMFYGTSSIPLPLGPDAYVSWYGVQYDTDTWTPLTVPNGIHGHTSPWDVVSQTAAYDPTTGKVYGAGSYGVGVLDYPNVSCEIINMDRTLQYCAMTIHPVTGVIYVITTDGSFGTLDKTTGIFTLLGTLDFNFGAALQSMTFDKRTGDLWAVLPEYDDEISDYCSSLRKLSIEDGHTIACTYLPENEQYTCLNIIYPTPVNAPADLTDLKAYYTSAVSDVTVEFTLPTTTVGGESINGNINYTITLADDSSTAKSGSAAAGSKVSEHMTPSAAGRMKVLVILSKDGVEGKRNAIESWSGSDIPMARDLTAEYDPSTETVTLNWSSPNMGANGGYVDAENVVFDVVRMPDNVKIVNRQKVTSATDNLSELPYAGYVYNVTAYLGDVEGKTVSTESFSAGKGRELPYRPDFTNESTMNDMLVIDANEDGTTFVLQPDWNDGVVWCEPNGSTDADDWLITPPLNFTAGNTYNLVIKCGGIVSVYTQKFEVLYGQGDDVTTYTSILEPTDVATDYYDTGFKEFKLTVAPEQSGAYRVGIHNISEVGSNVFMVEQFDVEEGLSSIAPAGCYDLNLTPGNNGDLTCNIAFFTPTKTVGGSDLASLTGVEIYRNDELIATLTETVPGTKYDYEDKDAINGMSTYTLIAVNETGQGVPVSESVYVGIDEPTSPTNLKIKDNLDGTATISWEAPTKGKHDAYIDRDELTYKVYLYEDERLVLKESDVEGLSATIDCPADGSQAFRFYSVSAVNDLGESEPVEAPAVAVGEPYKLPFMEGFSAVDLKGIWLPEGDLRWAIYSGMSADDDNYVMGADTDYSNKVGTLRSGKFSLGGASDPKLAFAFLSDAGMKNKIDIVVNKPDGTSKVAHTIDFSEFDQTAWRYAILNLDEYKNEKYITLSLQPTVTSDSEWGEFYFDDLNVRNVPEHNLTAYLDAQSRVTAGENALVNVTIHNVGQKIGNGYSIDVYVDDVKVGNVPCEDDIYPFNRISYSIPVETSVASPEEISIKAAVVYPADMIGQDDATDTEYISIYAPLCEAPETLSLSETDNEDILTWTPIKGISTVFDSFESYPSFKLDGFGSWKVVDGDGGNTMALANVMYPGRGQASSFFVVNFADMGATDQLYLGHTGEQYAACGRPNSGTNDDWMISPELSGDSQTVSFYAMGQQGILPAFFPYNFEVCASSTGTDIEDFTMIESFEADDENWAEFKVELPAGTKYFAIHCNASNGGVFEIDDVTYDGKPLTLDGYNIYRDGEKIATVNANISEYKTEKLEGIHTYKVSAQYKEMESATTPGVTTSNSAVGSVYENNAIIEYITPSGIRLGNKKAEPGIYIGIDSEGKAHKVIVGK